MKTVAVYAIRQVSTGIVYVGSSTNLALRWKRHRTDLNCGRHHATWLQRAWLKHGAAAFVFEVLEALESPGRLRERETWWMSQFQKTFNNEQPTDRVGVLAHGADTRDKMSASQRARFATERTINGGRVLSREHLELMTARRRATCGWEQISSETRAKMSASAKRRIDPDQMRAMQAKAMATRRYGTLSDEQKAKLRETHRGKKLSDAHREAIRTSMLARRTT